MGAKKKIWFWIIVAMQLLFIFKMVHDTYFNDRWATKYDVHSKEAVVKNIDYTLRDSNFSGTALVIRNHKVLLHKGYGKQNGSRGNDVDTLYNIASIEKSMTSVMVAKLIQDGRLNYSTKLVEFYPSIPNAENITIRNMLTMTSGLEAASDPERALNEKTLVNYYVKHIVVDPRKGWDYDAVNFHLLAGIITQITHKNYGASFDELVNLKSEAKVMVMPNFSDKRVALSYHKNGKPYANPRYIYSNEIGTGSFFMTAGDLYRYFAALVNGEILPMKTVKELFKTSTHSVYAGGVYHNKLYYRGHGILQGYEPSIIFNRTAGNAVVLLGNRKGKTTTMKLTNSIYSLVNETPYLGGNTY
jgi:CubicO group peptidase (beta-lactamase class C family)